MYIIHKKSSIEENIHLNMARYTTFQKYALISSHKCNFLITYFFVKIKNN